MCAYRSTDKKERKESVERAVCRGIVCVENYFVKTDFRLKPISVERTFS